MSVGVGVFELKAIISRCLEHAQSPVTIAQMDEVRVGQLGKDKAA